MANIITAGNSTNGGTAISTDTSGTLNIVTGSGSGATAVTVDGSGNVVVTGTITASGGVSGGIRSGTAVASTSGTSIDFTGIPTGVKRITVMFNGVSTNGTSSVQIQIGDSGGIEATAYVASANYLTTATANQTSTSAFLLLPSAAMEASQALVGSVVLTTLGSNIWTSAGILGKTTTTAGMLVSAGSKTLSDVLDRIRITTVNGTDTFDAGSINILFE